MPEVDQNIKPITRPMTSRAATTVIVKRASRERPAPKGLFLLGGEIPPGDAGVLPVGETDHEGEVCPVGVLPPAGGWLPVPPVPPVGGQSVIELVEL